MMVYNSSKLKDVNSFAEFIPRVDLINFGTAGLKLVQALPKSALAGFRLCQSPDLPESAPEFALLVVNEEHHLEAARLVRTLEASYVLPVILLLPTDKLPPGPFIRCAANQDAFLQLVTTLRRFFFGETFIGIDFRDNTRIFRGRGEVWLTEFHFPCNCQSAWAGQHLGAAIRKELKEEKETLTILLLLGFGRKFFVTPQQQTEALWHVDQILRMIEDRFKSTKIDFLFAGYIEEENQFNIKMLFG